MTALLSKIDISRILSGHLSTLGDLNGNNRIWDILLLYMMPVLMGVMYLIYGVDLVTKECWENLLLVNSIFLPLMLTSLISLYSMKRRYAGDKLALRLLDEVTDNTFYCVLLSLCAIVVSFVLELGQWFDNRFAAFIFMAGGSHGVLTILMLVKRFYALFKTTC